MFNIGFSEMLIIGVIVLLVIGPDKMPEFFRTAAKWMVKIRRSTNDIKHTVQEEFDKVAGEEISTLKNFSGGVNLNKRVDLDTLEKYMHDGSELFEKKNNDSHEADDAPPAEISTEDPHVTSNDDVIESESDSTATELDDSNDKGKSEHSNHTAPEKEIS